MPRSFSEKIYADTFVLILGSDSTDITDVCCVISSLEYANVDETKGFVDTQFKVQDKLKLQSKLLGRKLTV